MTNPYGTTDLYERVNIEALLERFEESEDDASEAHCIQGDIDSLEVERNRHIEAITDAFNEVAAIIADADGDEDWYDDVEQIEDDYRRLLSDFGVKV